MVAVIRLVCFGVVLAAMVMHIIGLVTPNWVAADVFLGGTADFMSAIDAGNSVKPNQRHMTIRLGLWKYCVKDDLGDSTGQAKFLCQTPQSEDVPDWMKATQALGIIALILAGVTVALMIYSCFGDGKGDRARLLPYIIGGVSLAAGILQLIGVIVYGAEYIQMMKNTTTLMAGGAMDFNYHAHLGYSFALEAVAGVLYTLCCLGLIVPAARGIDVSVSFGRPSNMAV